MKRFINRMRIMLLMLTTVGLYSCNKEGINVTDQDVLVNSENTGKATTSYTVSMGGNAYVTQLATGGTETVTATSLSGWTNPNSIFSAYFRLGLTGSLTIKVKATVPSGNSTIKVTINGVAYNVNMTGKNATTYNVATVNIGSAGYVKVDFQGISKTGSNYAEVSDLVISGAATASNVLFANDPANYYWSRRGPSVHLGYDAGTPASNNEWNYNEVTVPVGQDKIGSYFMANGFGEGYFGIQVNSATERRILFSVWDPTVGKTTLLRKGPNVIDNTFGGEGTGGQSYMLYNWVAGNTYKFLTQAKPDGTVGTVYSAWFYAPEAGSWKFIATWKRPNTITYLTGFYSFLENFDEEHGFFGRKVSFNNQWVRTVEGVWIERTTAEFTVDATGDNKQRMDYAGGVENGSFYLQNGGFFSLYVNKYTKFTRPASGNQPTVNLTTLP
jgi:hypothetical protein